MLSWLVTTSLNMRVLVLALACVLIVWGVKSVREAPLDVFPEFAPPLIEIQTEAPGLSAEEVESLITVPLENALTGIAYADAIRSKSVLGLSAIRLIFPRNINLDTARQQVQERIATAQDQLPSVAGKPHILPPLSSTSRAMKIGVWSDKLDQMEMTDLVLWSVRPRLMAIPGVANVAIWGQRDRQYQVLVDPDRLAANGVTLQELTKATTDAAAVASGGFIDTPNQRFALRHQVEIAGPEDIAATIVATRNGAPIRIGDVAEVVIGHPPPIGDAIINDQPGLLLIVEKQPWGNTLDVTRDVEAVLEALRPGLKDVEFDSTIFRPATFIERSLHNLGEALWLGCAFVVVILVLFLFDWRSAFISLIAIPLSLLSAALVLSLQGATLNTMTIAGLVIAIGEVVDDAIIDVENITRRLRLNREAGNPESSFQVVLKASLEVRSAVVYASLIVILVFVPVFFLPGLAGSFFRPLAMSYILAILASLVVALTVTPALCLMLLPKARRTKDSPLVRLLKSLYRGVLPAIATRPKTAIVILLVTFGVTGWSLPKLGEEFLPNFKETDFLMHWVEKPGTSLEAMTRITQSASIELRQVPGVRNFGSHIGRAEVADEVVGPNFTELWISLDEDVDYDETVAIVQEVVDGYPGLYRDLLTYLKERIKEVLSGASATVVIRIYGSDLEVLRDKAQEVKAAIAGVEGVADLKVETQALVPQLDVRLRPDTIANFGLTPGEVRQAVTTLVKGQVVGEIYGDQKIIRVAIWGDERLRGDLQAIRALPIESPLGALVPLGDLADIQIVPTPNVIVREGASRRIDVTCNVAGAADLGAVAREIEARVANVDFDRGYHPEFLGEYAAARESRKQLFALAGLALIGILVLLHVDFGSIRLTLLVAMTLPFALVGGVAGAFLSGGVLSLGSLVGFVTVLGIAARNGIMLISHYRHLEQEEGMEFGQQLLIRGAIERLAPILMTALCASLALLPLIIKGNVPGHEIEYPMAVVIVGGIATSTVLNLFLMPALYGMFGRAKPTSE